MKPSRQIINIDSPQNAKVKSVIKLREAKHRRKTNSFVVEGEREAQRAVLSGFVPLTVFVERSCDLDGEAISSVLQVYGNKTIFSVDETTYKKMAVREGTEKVIAVFENKSLEVDQLNLSDDAVICVLDGVEKPGNLGAILRSCEGAGVDLVVVSGSGTDLYNPNTIRTSVGAIFSLKIIVLEEQKVLDFLEQVKAKIYGAVLSDKSKSFYDVDLSSPSEIRAICLGTEASGLSSFWLERSEHIIIPMRGRSDSLNVSVAAAILLYEATRSR